jgi:glutathione S-transferase
VLRETGLPFKLDRIDLAAGKKTQSGESYVAMNAKGYIPALQLDDGEVLTEAAVIVQYVADLRPEAKLLPPAGSFARVRAQEWLNFLATELHKGLSPLYQARAGDDFKTWWRENKVEPRFNVLDKHLEGREFIAGDRFSVVDAYAFYVCRAWTGKAIKGDLSKWKNLAAHFARMSERPSVKAAVEAEAAPISNA